MWRRRVSPVVGIGYCLSVCLGLLMASDTVIAAEEKTASPAGTLEQVGTAVKNFATKLEEEVSGAVKKLGESETPKKVGDELQRSAASLGNKIEQAGQKVKEAFSSK